MRAENFNLEHIPEPWKIYSYSAVDLDKIEAWGPPPMHHPVQLTGRILILLGADHHGSLLEEHVRALAQCHDGGRGWLSYWQDFNLHANPEWVMRAPWHSGMAQGMALSVWSRLHDKRRAQETLQTLMPGEGVSHTDSDGFYWIEEYPWNPPTHVLNGFGYAIYGLYDYWSHWVSEWGTLLLAAGLTTLKAKGHLWRRPGAPSVYCLAHEVPCDRLDHKYHRVHVVQFQVFHRMTRDPRFQDLADWFMSDVPLVYTRRW